MSHLTMWMDVNVKQVITVLCYLRVAKEYIIHKRGLYKTLRGWRHPI